MKLDHYKYRKHMTTLVCKNRLLLLFSLLVTLFMSCTNEPYEGGKTGNEETITKDSPLFNLISQVTTESDEPLQEITCIDFIYSFKVLIYDSNLQVIGTKVLRGDDEFSAFLGALPTNQSISISYPITTTLADGTIFSVNNNTELKLAIESCSREDIIAYCNGLFGGNGQTECVWKVPYRPTSDNKYASGVFETNNDGTLRFTYNHETYNGTWTFLYINDEFHININLEGTSAVATYWNIDRKVAIGIDSIIIFNTPKNIHLKQSCETVTEYEIGSTGPAGGLVFYDKGYYSLGWRYMEVNTTDLGFFEWGCFTSTIANTANSGIGEGIFNTVNIVNFHDNLQNYYVNPSICSSQNNGTVVAKEALSYGIDNYKDWYLPSSDELHLLYENLHTQQLGTFTNSMYWSATELNQSNAFVVDFSTGDIISSPKVPVVNNIKTRVVRYF